MRPRRPAWTGSPDRRPSDIPAVDIPEEVRAARRRQRPARERYDGRGRLEEGPASS